MSKPFDPKLPVRTRDGKEARIICADRKDSAHSIVALYDHYGTEGVSHHLKDGRCFQGYDGPHDLVNIPSKRDGWVNIYPDSFLPTVYFGRTKEEADKYSTPARVACIHIEWEE